MQWGGGGGGGGGGGRKWPLKGGTRLMKGGGALGGGATGCLKEGHTDSILSF